MSRRAALLVSVVLAAVALAVGLLLSPLLPDPMPSHWNAAGDVDGYTSRNVGLWLLPLITVGLAVLLAVLPAIDPLRANVAKFERVYGASIVGILVYLLHLYALTLAAGLGVVFNMTAMLLPAMGLLFIGLGFLLRRAKRNFFIGIRTPWTLSSDQVWDQTHRVGAASFIVAGLVTLPTGFLGSAGIWVAVGAILVATLVPIGYSYYLFARLHR